MIKKECELKYDIMKLSITNTEVLNNFLSNAFDMNDENAIKHFTRSVNEGEKRSKELALEFANCQC